MTSELRNFVNGQFVEGGIAFDNINPVDGRLVCHVREADRGIVDAAVAAARSALTGPWGGLSVAERSDMLHSIADAMDARFEDFVDAEIADTGKPLQQTRTLDVPRGAGNFRFFADLIKEADAKPATYEMEQAGATNYILRKPLGVVGVISPWNLPLLLMTWKVAPALAAGNTIIAKPSEETPSSATLLAEVLHDAGLPEGVFNLVHGFGPGSAGEFLTTHKDVDAITFTGESATGSAIMKAVADTVKPVSFELGGKNAGIVFADADLEAAMDGTARSVFTNCGQVCLCTERVYVERPVFEQFVAGLKQRAEALVPGRPGDENTGIGPLISAGHRDKVLGYYRLAEQEGAHTVTGGGVPEFGDERDGGAYVQPTIWTGLAEDARCIKEEIFGPVCHVAPFDSEEEVIAMANDSEYGLAATVWSENLENAAKVASKIEAGIVWVNTWYLRDLRTPFGGVKLSGIGREGGMHSLDFYSELTNICVKQQG